MYDLMSAFVMLIGPILSTDKSLAQMDFAVGSNFELHQGFDCLNICSQIGIHVYVNVCKPGTCILIADSIRGCAQKLTNMSYM